jgi:hypothetical protein
MGWTPTGIHFENFLLSCTIFGFIVGKIHLEAPLLKLWVILLDFLKSKKTGGTAMESQLKFRFMPARNFLPTHRALRLIFPAVVAALLLTGCIYEGPPRRVVIVRRPAPVIVEEGAYPVGSEIMVDQAPPPPLEEVVPASPGVDFVWISGVWVWEGRWVWSPGHWAHPPRPGAVWVPFHYEFRNGTHVFIRGGWR